MIEDIEEHKRAFKKEMEVVRQEKNADYARQQISNAIAQQVLSDPEAQRQCVEIVVLMAREGLTQEEATDRIYDYEKIQESMNAKGNQYQILARRKKDQRVVYWNNLNEPNAWCVSPDDGWAFDKDIAQKIADSVQVCLDNPDYMLDNDAYIDKVWIAPVPTGTKPHNGKPRT